jgi:hypothetical protein
MYTITPAMSGKLLEWQVKEGQRVEKMRCWAAGVLPLYHYPHHRYGCQKTMPLSIRWFHRLPTAVIADTDNLYIGVNIEETDIVKIQVGPNRRCQNCCYGNKNF